MARVKSDLTEVFEHAIAGTLDQVEIDWDRRTALGVVLATLFAVLWLLRRLSGGRLTGSAPIRTVGGIAVGSRERVVLLEIGEHWLVVGVAPGSVTGIATLPRGEISPAGTDAKPVAADFGALLAKLKAGRS
jgi:flagellar protein FliO/FliZ